MTVDQGGGWLRILGIVYLVRLIRRRRRRRDDAGDSDSTGAGRG